MGFIKLQTEVKVDRKEKENKNEDFLNIKWKNGSAQWYISLWLYCQHTRFVYLCQISILRGSSHVRFRPGLKLYILPEVKFHPRGWFHLDLEERGVNGFPHGNNIAIESNVVIHLFVILERNTVMHTLWEYRISSNKRPWYDVYFKVRGIIHIRFLNLFNFQFPNNNKYH